MKRQPHKDYTPQPAATTMTMTSTSPSSSSSSTSTTPSLLRGLESTVGADVFQSILKSKILLVGSGGIGCELLKNLALSGFGYCEVIDLDTIDVSNLNRQFLFRSHHVGKPKCTVACDVAMNMSPAQTNANTNTNIKYIPHHGNVCDNSKFNVQYVQQFNLILNALDNVTARRRVNRLALAAKVPLVEAGTTGYLGQVTVIHKESHVECYECQPKPTQKVYPICTIRSTPSVPVHTIVWSKELYKLLFGPKPEDSMLYEDPQGEEPSTFMDTVTTLRSCLGLGNNDNNDNNNDNIDEQHIRTLARQLIEKLYIAEIEKQSATGRYKTAKKTPQPLPTQDVEEGTSSLETAPTKQSTYKSTDIWSCPQNMSEFVSCVVDAYAITQQHGGGNLLPEFDKDDMLGMRFITASSNLRSIVFGITPLQSFYSAKGIAGNIIPAIATTNAIVAGLQVLQVFHILKHQWLLASEDPQSQSQNSLKDVCRYTYCNREKTRKGLYLLPTTLPDPNPNCFVCRNATISLTLNVEKWTLEQMLDKILKQELGFQEPTILLEGDIVYEEGEGADTDAFQSNLEKVLPKLPCGGIQNGTVLRIEDFSQDLEVDVCVTHQDEWPLEEGEEAEALGDNHNNKNNNKATTTTTDGEGKYIIGGKKPSVGISASTTTTTDNGEDTKQPSAAASATATHDDDDDICIVEEEESNNGGKRSAENQEDDDMKPPAKKAKTDASVQGDNHNGNAKSNGQTASTVAAVAPAANAATASAEVIEIE